jgi:undecaprenyl-diphosphatase
MNILHALIMGIVEGITEFLPVSSTGHLILTADILNISQKEFLKSFEIVIQLGAILSVVFIYWKVLLVNFKVIKRVLIAFIPTGLLGLVFYRLIKNYLIGNRDVVLIALFLGGIFLIVFELLYREKENAVEKVEEISYMKVLLIGLAQSIAMIPGVSRSAATILGGLILGLKRKTIVEFSFLLAVPTMLAATLLDLFKNFSEFSLSQWHVLIAGFVTAFIVALLSIRWFLQYIQKHSFVLFGVYRICLALLFWWVL